MHRSLKRSTHTGTQSVRSNEKSVNRGMLGPSLYETMLSFLVCNNVTPILEESGRTLQAASPDEVSLVKFAEEMGFKLESRKLHSIKLLSPSNEELNFKIIRIFPFSSERKVELISAWECWCRVKRRSSSLST